MHSPWPGTFSIRHILTHTQIIRLTLLTQIAIFWEKPWAPPTSLLLNTSKTGEMLRFCRNVTAICEPCERNGKRLKLKMCCALQTHFLRLQLTIFINLVPNMHYAPSIILFCMPVNIHSLFSINSEEQARAARILF